MLTSKAKINKIIRLSFLFLTVIFLFSFTQTAKAQYAQYWLEYKDSSNIHHISDPFSTKPLCETWWTQNSYLLGTVIRDCFLSATIPQITPENCILPQVLDPTTQSCITPTPTCVSPQVLDPKTNTCVTKDSDTNYTLLAPLPDGSGGTLTDFESNPVKNPCPLGKYLNIMIKLFFGISGVLAVVMIVMGGIQYMTSELISSKEEGKKSITNAIFGLLLALSAWLILNTINPDLLNVCLDNLPKAGITISPETNEGTIGFDGKTLTVNGQTVTACKTDEITTLGSDGKTLTLFGSPIPGGVNKAVVKDIEAINTAWKNSNSAAVKNYKITTVGGGYNCRSVRGQPTKTSAHSFGIAIDINPSTNPFQPGATTCTTDMPPEFVQLFKNQGWGWGGNWSSVKDAMHFSKLSTEIGHKNPCGVGSGATQNTIIDNMEASVRVTYGGGLDIKIKKPQTGNKYQLSVVTASKIYNFTITNPYVRLKEDLGLIPPVGGKNYAVSLRRQIGSASFTEILNGLLFLKP